MKPARKRKPRAAVNRCADCGSFVGQKFTGFDRDRFSDRGALFCDSCTIEKEIQTMKNQKIKLTANNIITNDPCAICGNRCDPCGLDYMLGRRLVCAVCATQHAPDLVQAREAALAFCQQEVAAAFIEKPAERKELETLKKLVEHLRAALALMKPDIPAIESDLPF